MSRRPRTREQAAPRAEHLTRLLVRATMDPHQEPAFFRALLQATVYAHVPIADPQGPRLRFIQFPHPETGQLLLPFFTDQVRARIAAGQAARVVALPGRSFLEATRGATLVLNPNDERGLLYPEEIDALLRTGRVARIDKVTIQAGQEPQVGPPGTTPQWVVDLITLTLAGLPFVEVAYLASLHVPHDPDHPSLLLALGTTAGQGERAVHAVVTATQPACIQYRFPLDVMHFVEPDSRPAWIDAFALLPTYAKSWGARLVATIDTPPTRLS